MDLQVLKSGLEYTRKRKNWVLLLAALGFSGYGVYRVYQFPSMVEKRRRLFKCLGALLSVAEMVSDCAETIGVVSKDLKEFIQSDSDQIPNSLRQVSKITRSEVFSESAIRVTAALTVGIMRGCQLKVRNSGGMDGDSSFLDRVMDKLFSTAGSGFASIVVGSFARNLVMAFYSDETSSMNNSSVDHDVSESLSVQKWVNVVCGEKCRELVGDCVKLFVSTAVAIYLDKTMDINTYDEIFSGLTNPNHERKMREMLASICNGAIETLVKTSHQVLTSTDSNINSSASYLAIDHFRSPTTVNEELNGLEWASTEPKVRKSFDEKEDSGWVSKMSSTLAVPSNRRFVLDVTGRVTFETVRSFLEFLLEKLYDGLIRSLSVVHEVVVDGSHEVVRYVMAKSSVFATLCFSLCLHILGGACVLVPA